MTIEQLISKDVEEVLGNIYSLDTVELIISPTRPQFEGDYTVTLFPIAKRLSISPKELGEKLIQNLKNKSLYKEISIVGGFLNISVNTSSLLTSLTEYTIKTFDKNGKKAVVEFPSPNTNKPLHLGHLRNMFLGSSVSNILKEVGYEVNKVNLVNNRGIHICKSMLAYHKYGHEETPDSSGMKGDFLVGKYYVKFDQELKKELEELKSKGVDPKEAEKHSPLMTEVRQMLIDWENKDPETIALWNKMNGWVYDGFEETFKRLGVSIDKTYYESDTYLLGKDIVEEGLAKGVFYRKEDTSVWIDLSDAGMDEKILLRSDGTSVYMTQDLGTADQRYEDLKFDKSIYVVGNEQDYHFKVLFEILNRLGKSYAKDLNHLSYGMVDLPTGKMKSREGTVVDADQLVDDMVQKAQQHTEEQGKIDSFTKEETDKLYATIALGALRYFLLKVDPAKRMLFDPNASIDFQGDTGPFIQYTYARINSLLEKAKLLGILDDNPNTEDVILSKAYRRIIVHLFNYEKVLQNSADTLNPSILTQYVYELAKLYNKYYSEEKIISNESESSRKVGLLLSIKVKKTIQKVLSLLDIHCPERM